MTPTALAWARAQGPGTEARALAAAYTNGTTRVTFEGRTVEYRSLTEIDAAIVALYAAENPAERRPSATYARFQRG